MGEVRSIGSIDIVNRDNIHDGSRLRNWSRASLMTHSFSVRPDVIGESAAADTSLSDGISLDSESSISQSPYIVIPQKEGQRAAHLRRVLDGDGCVQAEVGLE